MRKKYTKRKTQNNIYITHAMRQKFKNIIQKASKSEKEPFNYESEVLDPFMKSINKKSRKTRRHK